MMSQRAKTWHVNSVANSSKRLQSRAKTWSKRFTTLCAKYVVTTRRCRIRQADPCRRRRASWNPTIITGLGDAAIRAPSCRRTVTDGARRWTKRMRKRLRSLHSEAEEDGTGQMMHPRHQTGCNRWQQKRQNQQLLPRRQMLPF